MRMREVHAAVGVVVALEDEVDFVFEDDGEPEFAEGFVVAAFGGAVHRVVEGEDCPVGLGFAEGFVEPGGLFGGFFERIEADYAGALEINVVVGIFETRDAVAGIFELGGPEAGDFSGFVFVVAGGGDGGDGAVEPAAGIEPLAPFFVGFRDVDEVARVEHEIGVGGVFLGLSDDAAPHGFDVILGVTEIDKGERIIHGGSGGEVEPFGPGFAIADAVAVLGFGF